ncbi:MAG TPA: hypothetical protein VGM90_24240 [Kofleriaceae bacterium]|jgi:hypothetical protein
MSTAVMQALGIAQALVDTHRDVLQRYTRAVAGGDESTADVTRGEAERSFSGIWDQLDTAAKLTREAGRDTSGYDQVSASGASHGVSIPEAATRREVAVEYGQFTTTRTYLATLHANDQGLNLARQALMSLWSAWPELAAQQNAASSQPVADLRPGGIFGFISRLFGG